MPPILELKNITKVFPGVRALDDVSYSLQKGEVSALLGENGAGKSTLIKIISGVYEATEGELFLNGAPVHIRSASDAQRLGIGTIHQEFNLFANMTVLENIAFCSHLNSFSGKLLNWKELRKKAKSVLEMMQVSLPLNSKIKYLTVANQQLVEIAKALMLDAKVLIMDEPTAALTELEIAHLFKALRTLRESGVSIIYISHRMNEIMNICESITVLRDGKLICSGKKDDYSEHEIAGMITGKDEYLTIAQKQRSSGACGDVKLQTVGLTCAAQYRDINLEVGKGEIFGLLGPLGAGKTEIGKTLFGLMRAKSGQILLDGKPVDLRTPSKALKNKIAYISEDRKRSGVLTNMSLLTNISIVALMLKSKRGFIRSAQQRAIAEEYVALLKIKTPSIEQNINFLSGGNQQKAIIARFLAVNPDVLILDQPTRGLDIGAKDEIRKLLHGLADQGVSVIVLTMEVPEALELCDRIAILKGGRIENTVYAAKTSPEQLTAIMLSK